MNKNDFVALGTAQLEEPVKEMEYMLSEEELKLAGNYFYNQVQRIIILAHLVPHLVSAIGRCIVKIRRLIIQ